MMDEQNIYDYLDGKLSGQPLLDFEKELRENQDLRSEVSTLSEMRKFLQESPEEKKAVHSMQNFHEEYIVQKSASEQTSIDKTKPSISTSSKTLSSKRKFLYLIPASIAAIVLAGFFLKPLFQQQTIFTSNEIFAAHFTPSEMSFGQKGGDESTALLRAEQAFNSKDYNNAAAQLSIALEANPTNYEAILYRAISQLALGNINLARSDLNVIRSNRLFAPAANLYDALSYIKEGQNDAAIPLLQQIPETSSFHKQAQEILNKLQ